MSNQCPTYPTRSYMFFSLPYESIRNTWTLPSVFTLYEMNLFEGQKKILYTPVKKHYHGKE